MNLSVWIPNHERKPKLSRHINWNHTNIALLLQEATQKYQKLTDY